MNLEKEMPTVGVVELDREIGIPETFEQVLDFYGLKFHGWYADSAEGFLAPYVDENDEMKTLQLADEMAQLRINRSTK
jgi:hypothetical protein